nr:MMPL family transporter [Streptomyces sp. ME19-01-6]
MATFLYRLGRWAFRRRRYVALLWAAVLAVVAFGACHLGREPLGHRRAGDQGGRRAAGSGGGEPVRRAGVSKDASTAYATVTYEVKGDDLTDAGKKELQEAIAQARDAGLTVEAGGSALETESPAGVGEVIGVVIAAVVLERAKGHGPQEAAGLAVGTAGSAVVFADGS